MNRFIAVAVAFSVFSILPLALGAEVKVEGVLKAVDAKTRTLTVEKKTAKGTKELCLEVAEEAGDLASLKVGDEVSVNYDSTLEVVTKIGGALGGASTDPVASTDSPEGFVELIANNGLDGWHLVVRPQDKDKPGMAKKVNWEVRDGVLTNTAVGRHLASDEDFADFELSFDFQVPADCNSGIYLRGRYELKLKDADPLETKPLQRCGAIYGLIAPSANAFLGPDKWNTCKVTLQGKAISVAMNGKMVIDNKELKGVTSGAFSDAGDESGPLILHSHPTGSGIMYRNMRIRPLGK